MAKQIALLSSGELTLDEEFISELFRALSNENAFERLMVKRLTAGLEIPSEMNATVQQSADLLSHAVDPRQFMFKVLRTVLPKKRPGRGRKIKPEQMPDLLRHAERLQPCIRALMTLRKVSPQRSIAEIVEYLRPQYIEEADFVRKHLIRFEEVISDPSIMSQVKTSESAIRLIADAMAGAEFGLAVQYSISVVRKARRDVSARKAMAQKKT